MPSISLLVAFAPLLVSAVPVHRRGAVILAMPDPIVFLPTGATLTATETLATPTTIALSRAPMSAALGAVNLGGLDIVLEPSATTTSLTAPVAPTAVATPGPLPSQPAQAPSHRLMMAYYPDWAGTAFPPEKISFDRFDWIDFAFALPDERFGLTWDDPVAAPKLLKRLVAAAHSRGKKVKLSIGGWTGSKYFSPAVSTATNRLAFVNDIISAYTLYNLDGIDIDWEYPGQPGNTGNIMDKAHDTANFLLFLQLLRTALPPSAVITAAALTQPWADASGQPLRDMSQFAAVLDWVLLMNYDVWGSSPTPGPNAPLSDACGSSTQPGASVDAAVRTWTAAGFPADKLVLGLPAYGYISASRAERLHGRADNGAVVVKNEGGGVADGQVQFRELVRLGALVDALRDPGTRERANAPSVLDTAFFGAHGYERNWDDCSSTPFLRSSSAGQVITYDDPQSIGLKAALANKLGLKGVNIFDVHGDTDNWDLTDAARRGLYSGH